MVLDPFGESLIAELQAIVAEAVGELTAANDWDRASRLVSIGQRLRDVVTDGAGPPRPAGSSGARSEAGSDEVLSQGCPKAVRETQTRAAKAGYPRFYKDASALVKVGWSKSQGSEYEHKCPRPVLDALTVACARVTGSGGRFTMDKLLPLRRSAGGDELPEYQAYVALAWLRHLQLVVQHGRSGYSIPKVKDLASAVAAAWDRLPAR